VTPSGVGPATTKLSRVSLHSEVRPKEARHSCRARDRSSACHQHPNPPVAKVVTPSGIGPATTKLSRVSLHSQVRLKEARHSCRAHDRSGACHRRPPTLVAKVVTPSGVGPATTKLSRVWLHLRISARKPFSPPWGWAHLTERLLKSWQRRLNWKSISNHLPRRNHLVLHKAMPLAYNLRSLNLVAPILE